MEKSRIFVVSVATIGVLALVFQAIGFFAPAWIVFDMNIDQPAAKMSMEVSMGLWVTTACVKEPELGAEQCQALSNDQIRESANGAPGAGTSKALGMNFLDEFDTVKALATTGVLLSIVGLVCGILFGRVNGTTATGIIAASAWGVGAILWFAAIGLQAQQNSNFNHGIDLLKNYPEMSKMVQMKILFPWAILISGFGAALNVVVAGIIAVKTCYMISKDPNAPGIWYRFNNQAV